MLSSQVASILNEMRDSPEGNWYADILTRALAAQSADLVGTLKIELDERDLNVQVHPPDYPNLQFEDALAALTVTNRYGFMSPGDKGARGGWTLRTRGPIAATPNKDGDLVFYAPNGGIDAKQFYMNGHEIPLPPDSGNYVLIVEDGEFSWEELEDC